MALSSGHRSCLVEGVRAGKRHSQRLPAGGMRANSRSVTAIRNADEENYRIAFPRAPRPGEGRKRDDDQRKVACPYRLHVPIGSRCACRLSHEPSCAPPGRIAWGVCGSGGSLRPRCGLRPPPANLSRASGTGTSRVFGRSGKKREDGRSGNIACPYRLTGEWKYYLSLSAHVKATGTRNAGMPEA